MKLISNKLIINSIFNNLLIGEIQKPVNLYSIQSIKKFYLDQNIYYDFYNEFCISFMSCDYKDECLLDRNLFKFYNKYPNLNIENVITYDLIIKWNILYPPHK